MINNAIHILDKNIASKIAAGEVIINPASVVKELIENAIDANATSITIDIQSGGKKCIRVTDNGIGMNAEDIKLCVHKHATSKIRTFNDLKTINTLGFRGEALASISAVSNITIKSRKKDNEIGAQLIINGGSNKEFNLCGCPDGTTVKVKNLFFNLPARRKFLKQDSVETTNISIVVAKMIIAHPEISFKYISNENIVYISSGNGKLDQAIRAVYGKDLIDKLIPINLNSGYIKIEGYISRPSIQYKTKKNQLFVFNGRYFNSKQITRAVNAAYNERILKSHYPAVFLNIYMSPDKADVNIHPAKTELLFYDEEILSDAITNGISNLLSQCEPEKLLDLINFNVEVNPKITLSSDEKPNDTESKGANQLYLKNKYRLSTSTVSSYENMNCSESALDDPVSKTENQVNIFDIHNNLFANEKILEINDTEINNSVQIIPYKQDSSYKIVGQVFNTYLLYESGETLYIIDQHAAHERINFEKLRFQMQNNRLLSQTLLTPIIKKFHPDDFELLLNNENLLIELGFELDEFGALTYRFSGFPIAIKPEDGLEVIDGLLDELKQNNKEKNILLKKERIIKNACKKSIKGGEKLTINEIDFLIKEIKDKNIIPTCPHGRPIITAISKTDLEKGFKRVL